MRYHEFEQNPSILYYIDKLLYPYIIIYNIMFFPKNFVFIENIVEDEF